MTALEEIESADQAFLSASTPKELNGRVLEPFSLMRQTAAMEIAPPDASAFAYATIQVWLCTLKPNEVARAWRNKEQCTIDAFTWATKEGFSFTNWKPLLDIYKRLNEELAPAVNVQINNDGAASPNEHGELPAS